MSRCKIGECRNKAVRSISVFGKSKSVCESHAKQFMHEFDRYYKYKKKNHMFGAKKLRKEILQKFGGEKK